VEDDGDEECVLPKQVLHAMDVCIANSQYYQKRKYT
jgi:hypothetical protein